MEPALEIRQAGSRRFDDHLPLLVAFHGSAPAEEGIHFGEHVHTGREPLLDEARTKHGGIYIQADGGQHDHVPVSHRDTSSVLREFASEPHK